MSEMYFKELIEFVKSERPSKQDIAKKKVVLCKKHKMKKIPTDIEVLLRANTSDLRFVRKFLMTKPMRTGSGVAVVAIMSAPFRCPHGKCTYCPGGPGSVFGDVPQSYTGNEPATMRGIRNNYDAYLQVMNRLEQYVAIGQNPEKIELIIMGGTFPSFKRKYQEDFVRDALRAMNDFSENFYFNKAKGLEDLNVKKYKKFFELPGDIKNKTRTNSVMSKLKRMKDADECTLYRAQKVNETSKVRCIGMTIETKPDWGLLKQGNEMLKLGCTRVELGIQTLFDDALKDTHRGHTLQQSKDSIKTLKDLGFKLNFHMMPGYPGVSKKQDIWCFKELFFNQSYKPDMMKIYPTMVMPGTKLYLDFKQGKYEPLSTSEAAEIIAEGMRFVPRYCRIMRVQRDIPTKYSKAGVDKNNLRQLVDSLAKRKKIHIQDIKSREIGRSKILEPIEFEVIEYASSDGNEFFLGLNDSNGMLLGFLRLRFISKNLRKEFTENSAIVRELHVYGEAIGIGEESVQSQHRGFGRKLMEKAEYIARTNAKDKMLIISGIGVREYYRKLGYKLEGPYMAKYL